VFFRVPFNAEYSYQWNYNNEVLPNATSNILYAKDAGYYRVVLYNGNCPATSWSRQVVYKPGLPKPVLYVFGPNAWYFVCSIDYADVYQWYYNGTLVAQNNKNMYYAGNHIGEYYVVVNDGADRCYVPSDKIIIPLNATALNPAEFNNEITIFPNPNNGSFTIINMPRESGSVYYRIIDPDGKIFENGMMEIRADDKITFNCGMIQEGIYILEIYTNTLLKFSEKLVIKKH